MEPDPVDLRRDGRTGTRFPAGASNVDPDPGNAAAYIPTLADAQNPPAPFPGAIDAELATVTASSAGLVYETQNMQTFGLDTWSRDAQLLGRGTKVGDFVTLSIPAPDSAPRSVIVSGTRAPDSESSVSRSTARLQR